MRTFKISSFEYLPGTDRNDAAFVTGLTKINAAAESNGVYGLDVPSALRAYILTYAKVPNPLIVFLPHFQGVNDLDRNPRSCPGGLAVQVEASSENKRLDFATVVQCLAEPTN